MGIPRSAAIALVAVLLSPVFLAVVPLRQIFDGFDPASVSGQRVLVCGASGGIGEQMVYKYAELGAHVVMVARRKPQLDAVAKEALRRGAASATAIVGDMESESSTVQTVAAALDLPAFDGALDVLILNHAVQYWDWLLPPADEMHASRLGSTGDGVTFSFIDTMTRTNFLSFVKLTVAALPALVRGASTGHGRRSTIIVVSSGAGKLPCPKQSVYAGLKHALHGFFDSLRLEVEHKRLPVTITTVILGTVATDQFTSSAGDDVAWPPPISAESAALGIIRGGSAGLEELYLPLSQWLHVTALLRPFPVARWLLDRLTLAMSGGRNVMLFS